MQLPRFSAKAFTLIELLIVVAIIAILAAIAVPNFLEAQTRAKISRVKNDMRTIAIALESYHVDSNQYPFKNGPIAPGLINIGSILGSWVPQAKSNLEASVTTPISYLSSVPADVFAVGAAKLGAAGYAPGHPVYGFRYTRMVARPASAISGDNLLAGSGGSDLSGSDAFGLSTRADRYGGWFMLSNGPDLDDDVFGFNNQYDPTNGTVSNGDVLYSAKNGFNGDRI